MDPACPPDGGPPSGPTFATTRWSVVLEAKDGTGPQSAEALASLCRTYWFPLYAFVRRSGSARDEAEDLVQGFFADFLARGHVAGVDPAKGSFRGWLLGAFRHFLAHERERVRAAKRGCGAAPLSLDAAEGERRLDAEAGGGITPERAFDRAWIHALLDTARDRLRDDYTRRGQAAVFDRLSAHIGGGGPEDGHESAARELGMSLAAVKVATHRLRRRFGEILRGEVAATLKDRRDVDQELRELLALLV